MNSIDATADVLRFRLATIDDVGAIVGLLADDPLGASREQATQPLPASYFAAFAAIDSDPNNELVVAELPEHGIVGVLQLTVIPYLTHCGRWRALIEGVRVARQVRSLGLGRRLFQWAIERAQQRGCRVLQLTTDKRRPDALRFYEALGFVASHEGMKLDLPATLDRTV